VILFLANQNVRRDSFRASLSFYFLVLNVTAVPAFLAAGLLPGSTAAGALVGAPVVLAGGLLGTGLSRRFGEDVFRRTVLVFLVLLGAMSVLGAGLGIP